MAISSIVQVGIKEALIAGVPDLCDPKQAALLTCPYARVFYSSSIIWCVLWSYSVQSHTNSAMIGVSLVPLDNLDPASCIILSSISFSLVRYYRFHSGTLADAIQTHGSVTLTFPFCSPAQSTCHRLLGSISHLGLSLDLFSVRVHHRT